MSLKEKIICLKKEGYSYREIALKTGASKSTISFHCRKNGLQGEFVCTKPSNEEIRKMQEMYDITKSCNKVAEMFGKHKSTVLKYIKTKKVKYTKEEKKERQYKRLLNFRKKTKIKLVDYKGGKCEICGYNKCVSAMEFHHLDKNKKDFNISNVNRCFEKLKSEVDKCMLVCSNCHREIHCIIATKTADTSLL